MKLLIFLACEVKAWASPSFTMGHGLEGVRPLSYQGTNIILRAFRTDTRMVLVMDFIQTSGGGVPRLSRISEETPTPDDLAYIEALEKFDIRPVDVHGVAA